MKAIENFSGNPLYRLLSFEELPQLYKELILSRYGTPYTDRPAGDRTVPGKDPLSGIFGADSEPRTDHPEKRCHSLETGRRLSLGTPLSRIKSSKKNETEQGRRQILEKAYAIYREFRRTMGLRCLSRQSILRNVAALIRVSRTNWRYRFAFSASKYVIT